MYVVGVAGWQTTAQLHRKQTGKIFYHWLCNTFPQTFHLKNKARKAFSGTWK